MKTSAILIAIIITVVVVLWFWVRSRAKKGSSFWDMIRNPHGMPDFDQMHREVEETAAALSGGDHWQDAHDGLASIGAVKRHRLMSETIAAFGDVKPSEDHETRRTQLSKLIRKGKGPFEEQDSQWYKLEEENLNRMVFKYNLVSLKGRENPV